MFQKILLAYDCSQGAERAFHAALELAKVSDAELWVVSVEENLPRFAATVSETEEEKEFADNYYQQCISTAYLRAIQDGVHFKSEVRVGHAARTIIDFANEGHFDLVVLGRSGRSGVWATFLGTTAEKVSRHVSCNVFLVK